MEKIDTYVTKYALSQGIFKTKARICHGVSSTMIEDLNSKFPQHYHYNEWFLTMEEAKSRAEQMRTKKIKSLEKQIATLKKVKF